MRFLRAVLSNLFTILLSIGLAILIWLSAVQQGEDPLQTESLQIPVEFIGQPEDVIRVSPTSQTVQILFQGRTSAIAELTASDFRASVDLSSASTDAVELLPINVSHGNENITISLVSPEDVQVQLERLVTRNVPVELDTRGSVARGHAAGTPLLDPPEITVSGPASRVENLDSARVSIFLNNERENVIESVQPIFYDQQVRVASVSGLDLSAERVNITIPVDEAPDFAEKIIVVNRIGQVAPGYRVLSVVADPPSVLVQGLPTALNSINQIQTEPIDITGLSATFEQRVTLNLPPGISLDQEQEISITVEIEPFFTTSTFTRLIEVQGLSEDDEAIVEPEQVRVVLFGPLPILDSLSPEEVRVTVDIFELQEGTYSLTPDVVFPDRGIEVRSIQPELVTVTISETVTATDGVTNSLTIGQGWARIDGTTAVSKTMPLNPTFSLISPNALTMARLRPSFW